MQRLQEDTAWADRSFQDAERYLHPKGGGAWGLSEEVHPLLQAHLFRFPLMRPTASHCVRMPGQGGAGVGCWEKTTSIIRRLGR